MRYKLEMLFICLGAVLIAVVGSVQDLEHLLHMCLDGKHHKPRPTRNEVPLHQEVTGLL